MMRRLAEHLNCAAWVQVPSVAATDSLRQVLERFGPVRAFDLDGWPAVKAQLLPLKSFATRYAVLDRGDWTVVVNDRYGEMGLVDGLAISRTTGCRAIAASFRDDSRQWHSIVDGRIVRSVVCYLDGEKWFFHETGTPDACEDVTGYSKQRIRDRLPADVVCQYVRDTTRLACPPDWTATRRATVLQRSTKDLVVPLTTWETLDDV